MRLLSVIHGPVYGGAHTQLLRLREPLSAHGWETLAVVPEEAGNGRGRLEQAGVEVIALPLHRLRATPDPRVQGRFLAGFRREVATLRGIIRDRGIDLVQVHGPTNPHAAVAAHLEGVAVVWQIYDTVAPMWLRRLTMPLVVRLADAITVWGMELARSHPGALRLGDRLVPVFPPVDVAAFDVSPEGRDEARRRLSLPNGSFAIGTLGVRNPSKGHEYFVRAAARIHSAEAATAFRVLGSGSPVHATHEAMVEREARRLGLDEPSVLDFVDPSGEVPRLLPGLDLFVMTSVPRSEGVPTAILEAMACGHAVVSTGVGAIGELVEHEITGLLVPPNDPAAIGDAVIRLIRDDRLREAMGGEGRERAIRRYDLESLARVHLDAYERALAHRRERSAR